MVKHVYANQNETLDVITDTRMIELTDGRGKNSRKISYENYNRLEQIQFDIMRFSNTDVTKQLDIISLYLYPNHIQKIK